MRTGGYSVETILILCLLLVSGVVAQNSQTSDRIVPEIRATRINPSPPVIDGRLDDEIWLNSKIEFARDFLQMEPDEGQPASESTLVAVAYDDEAIYFAFWNFDSQPDKIQRQLVRRDRWAESDAVSVRIDAYHDHQTGYQFELSAASVKRDRRLFDDTNADEAWNGVWEGAVTAQPWGWSAEFRIPYHCLRFSQRAEHTWGLNVTRYISRNNESDWWTFSPSSEGGSVSRFGHLTNIDDIKSVNQMEILPYIVSSLESSPKSVGNIDGKDYLGNIGFDAKYAISSNLILDATLNPDFGQVELDSPVLNLSAFETFLPERRPFFLEGSDLFSTRFMLFYSRRIGRTPRGVDDDNLEYYVDRPKATTILGAAKLTGKLAGGTSIGFLNAVTAKEMAGYMTVSHIIDTTFVSQEMHLDTISTDTLLQKGLAEPRGNYSVFRLKQDIFNNSHIGLILTNAMQDSRNPSSTGGVDTRLLSNNGVWGVAGQAIFSRNDNQNIGYGITGEIMKAAGTHFQGSLGGTIKSPELYINRLGFTPRSDLKHSSIWMQYRTRDDIWIIRNSWTNFNFDADWNFDGCNIEKGWNVNFFLDLNNNWGIGGGFNQDFAKFDDWETWGNGLWEPPKSWNWWAELNTDERKTVSLRLNPGSGESRYGKWWAHYTGIDIRPATNLELSAGVNYVRYFGQTRFVEMVGDDVVFASLDMDKITPRLSMNLLLNPNLSLQVSSEALMAALDYSDARRYLGGNRYQRMAEITDDNYDYVRFDFNSTFLVRWEYLPGSTLYLVWTRSRPEKDQNGNNLEASRDIDRLFARGADNVFLIKTSYWWNI